MNKMKTLLVDDESDSIEVLQLLLADNDNIQIIGAVNSVQKAKEHIEAEQPDLLLLDIEMPGKNGFDLLEYFHKPEFKVVFVTTYDHYAIRAIKYAAMDYILKPINKEELECAINRVMELKLWEDNRLEHLKNLHDEEIDRIIISSQNGFKVLNLGDIVSIESKPGKYALFSTKENEHFLCTKSLKYYDELFPRKSFCRIHKSFIVNLSFVMDYNSQNGKITLLNGEIFEVATRRRSEFNHIIKKRFPN